MLQRSDETHLHSLLSLLDEHGYRFTTVTPATHRRVLARSCEARNARDVFGWSLPFRPGLLPPPLLQALLGADAVEEADAGLLKSRLRVASAFDVLFLHSAFPTEDEDAVFFGPDTYRFLRFMAAELRGTDNVRRLVDFGAGSGAGGILAAAMLPDAQISLCDMNPRALRLAAANARHAGVRAELLEAERLEEVEGPIDLVIANPPFMIDEEERSYRNGGDLHGAGLSLEWALAGCKRLEPGGRMLLYTGVAMVDGRDRLREALERELPALGCTLRYEEIDPDIFGEELDKPAYRDAERIAAVGAVIRKDPAD